MAFKQYIEDKYAYREEVEIEIYGDKPYSSTTWFGSKKYKTPFSDTKTRKVHFFASPEGIVAVTTTFSRTNVDHSVSGYTRVIRTKLGISSKPSKAKIFVGGKNTRLLTSETLDLGMLAEPEISLVLKKTGYKDATRTVTVKEGEKTEIHVVMRKV